METEIAALLGLLFGFLVRRWWVLALPLTTLIALDPPHTGFAGSLIALAFGHNATIISQKPQARWRFSAGAPFMEGLMQAALIAMAAAAVLYRCWFAPLCIVAWAASLWWYGRMWDRPE